MVLSSLLRPSSDEAYGKPDDRGSKDDGHDRPHEVQNPAAPKRERENA